MSELDKENEGIHQKTACSHNSHHACAIPFRDTQQTNSLKFLLKIYTLWEFWVVVGCGCFIVGVLAWFCWTLTIQHDVVRPVVICLSITVLSILAGDRDR